MWPWLGIVRMGFYWRIPRMATLPGSQTLVSTTTSSAPDLDGNCTVGGGDFGLFAGCWLSTQTGPGEPCEFMDFDCNGTVAGGDFALFSGAWLKNCEDLDATAYAWCWTCYGPVVCPWPPP